MHGPWLGTAGSSPPWPVDVAVRQGDFTSARWWVDEALQNRVQSGDELGRLHALLLLGMLATAGGDPGGSIDTLREAIELARRLDEPHNLARGLNNLAMALMAAGLDIAGAEQLAQESVDLSRSLGPSFHLE